MLFFMSVAVLTDVCQAFCGRFLFVNQQQNNNNIFHNNKILDDVDSTNENFHSGEKVITDNCIVNFKMKLNFFNMCLITTYTKSEASNICSLKHKSIIASIAASCTLY